MDFIWWAPFKDTIGSAGTFALATRGSETRIWVAHASRPPQDGFAVANVLVAVSRRNELPKKTNQAATDAKQRPGFQTRKLGQQPFA
jgi:hypothetical protein